MSQEGENFRIISDPLIAGPIIQELQQFRRDSDLANVAARGLSDQGVSVGWIAVENGTIYGPSDQDGIFQMMAEAGVDPRYARVKNLAPHQWPPNPSKESDLFSEQPLQDSC